MHEYSEKYIRLGSENGMTNRPLLPFVQIPPDQPAEVHREEGPLWGKYTPFGNGLFVLGPDKDIFVCTVSALIFLGVILGLQYNVISDQVGEVYALIGCAVFMVTVGSFLVTSMTDPGVMPKGQGLPENWWLLDRYKDDYELGYRLRYCRKCESVRPPRTYHCDLCDVCIRRQDMHLFIGGICIGERNFQVYLSLTFFQVVLACYLITVNAILLCQTTDPDEAEKLSPKDVILASISFFIGFVILMTPQTGLLMFTYRFYLLAKDRTLREEYRTIKRINTDLHVIKRSGWTNFISTFHNNRKFGKSCFHLNMSQVGHVDSAPRLYMYPDLPYSHSYLPVRHTQAAFASQNSANYRPTISNLLDLGNRRIHQPASLNNNNEDTAKAKRNETSTSLPKLTGGELPLLPGDKIRLEKSARPSTSLQRKIKRYQEVQEMPKPFIDFHVHHQLPSSLSEGSMPRTPMTPDVLNEMIQLARATQIRRVIEFVLARDRRGLVRMAQRVDMGGILGMQHAMDADNLQVIELGGQQRNNMGAIGGLAGRRNVGPPPVPIPFNLPAGLPQLVAAGLLPRVQGRMARHLTPANLNALRGQHIRDLYRADQNNRRESLRPPLIPAPPPPPPPRQNDSNRNINNARGQRTETGPVRSRVRRRERRIARAAGAAPTTSAQPDASGQNEENNNVVVIFVNSQDTIAQPSTPNLDLDDINQNQS